MRTYSLEKIIDVLEAEVDSTEEYYKLNHLDSRERDDLKYAIDAWLRRLYIDTDTDKDVSISFNPGEFDKEPTLLVSVDGWLQVFYDEATKLVLEPFTHQYDAFIEEHDLKLLMRRDTFELLDEHEQLILSYEDGRLVFWGLQISMKTADNPDGGEEIEILSPFRNNMYWSREELIEDYRAYHAYEDELSIITVRLENKG